MSSNALTTIGRANCTKLGEEIAAAVELIAAKYGLVYTREGSRYSDDQMTFKGKLQVKSDDGVGARDKADWERYAAMYGGKPEWFGREFRSNGRLLRVMGLLPKGKKNVVSIQDVHTGAKMKCSMDMLAFYLNK